MLVSCEEPRRYGQEFAELLAKLDLLTIAVPILSPRCLPRAPTGSNGIVAQPLHGIERARKSVRTNGYALTASRAESPERPALTEHVAENAMSDHDLRADLDHAVRGDSEISCRILCRSREPYEELLLPERHL
jgi:hypothetical protein